MKKFVILLACVSMLALPAGTFALIGVPVIFPINAQLDFKNVENGLAKTDVPVLLDVKLDQAFPLFKVNVDWGDGHSSYIETRNPTVGTFEHIYAAGEFELKIVVRDSTTRSRTLLRKLTVE
jgi:hypothetical protein